MFQLDKSGSLCLQKDRFLDREVNAITNLVVRASDDCNEAVTPSAMEPSQLNRPQLYDPLDDSLLWVRVNVTDVNDFRPVFVRRDLALGITRGVQLGKIIYNLKVRVRRAVDCSTTLSKLSFLLLRSQSYHRQFSFETWDR